MTREDIERKFKTGRKCIGCHDKLFALTVAADTDYDEGWEELVFTVPIHYLRDYMNSCFRQTGGKWTTKKIRKWLRCEYTSQDAYMIFMDAADNQQLVTITIF